MISKVKRFIKTDLFIYSALALAALVTRIPFLEKFQSHLDGPQYSIAVVRYSFAQETPAFPGYPLYIGLAKIVHLFLSDPYRSILAVSILGSTIGTVLFFYVGKKMYDRKVGIAAAIIFLTGSTFYYLGLTAYAYILTPITTTLIAYSVYRIFIKNKQEGVFLGIALGISVGVRPQEAIQIILLFLLGFLFLKKREKIKSLIAFALVTLLWFIPVINAVGFNEYIKLFIGLRSYDAVDPILSNAQIMIKGFLLSFGLSGILLLYYFFKYIKKWEKTLAKNLKIVIFYSLWIIPGLMINLFLRAGHAGYLMTSISGFLFLISFALWKITEKKKILYVCLLTLIAVFNLFWFFYNRDPNFSKPYRFLSFHYSEIVKNDLKLGGKIIFIRKNYDPNTTFIITNAVYWRQFSYYLNNYQITDIEAIDTNIPRYMYINRDTIGWNRKEYVRKNLFLDIPSNIKTIIFTDDNAKSYIKNYSSKTYSLPGNSRITSISVAKNEKMIYGYHSVEIKSQ